MCGRSSGSTTASFASEWGSKITPTSSRTSSAHSASDRLSSGMSTLPGSCPPRMVIPSSEHMTRILTIIQCRSVYISSVGRSAARQPRVVENQHLPHRHPPFGIVEEPHDSGRRGRGAYSHSVLFPILVHLAQKVHFTRVSTPLTAAHPTDARTRAGRTRGSIETRRVRHIGKDRISAMKAIVFGVVATVSL